MAEESSFPDLVRRVRVGDQDAATELVNSFEPAIRRAVRFQMRDKRLRRVFDSMDICQSVLASFFVRAGLGQYELDKPEQLLKLLSSMARNKVINLVHHQQADCRDHRRVAAGSADSRIAAAGSSPSQHVSLEELMGKFRQQMSEDELWLADQRALGRPWNEIAAEIGGNADALPQAEPGRQPRRRPARPGGCRR